MLVKLGLILTLSNLIFSINTPHLNKISESIRKALNEKVDPCLDFYEFACGNWPNEHKLSQQDLELSTFSLTSDEINKEIMSILNTTDTDDKDIGLIKAKKHYQACINLKEIQNQDIKPLKDFLNKFQIPLFGIKNKSISTWDPIQSLFKYTKQYAITPLFFDVDVTHDHLNSSNMIIKVYINFTHLIEID